MFLDILFGIHHGSLLTCHSCPRRQLRFWLSSVWCKSLSWFILQPFTPHSFTLLQSFPIVNIRGLEPKLRRMICSSTSYKATTSYYWHWYYLLNEQSLFNFALKVSFFGRQHVNMIPFYVVTRGWHMISNGWWMVTFGEVLNNITYVTNYGRWASVDRYTGAVILYY